MATQTQQLDLEGIKTIQLELRNGRVVVHGEAGKNEVTLDNVQEGDFAIDRHGNTLVIGAKHKLFNWRHAGGDMDIDLSLAAPINLDIRAARSDMRIDGPLLSLQVGMGEGSVAATNAGNIEVKAGSSNVSISHNKGDVAAKLGGGTINIVDVEGAVVVQSGGGEVKLKDIVGSLEVAMGQQSVTCESVTLPAGSQNRIRIGGQQVKISGLAAPGGLIVSGKTHDGPLNLNLKDYELNQQKRTFSATLAGDNQAQLRVETPGEINLST